MRAQAVAVLAGLLAVGACENATGPAALAASSEDAVFLAAVTPVIGELGQYLAPALQQFRASHGDAATGERCAGMQRLRTQLDERELAGDSAAASRLRLRLRVAASQLIHEAIGPQALHELLRLNERAMEQLREQARLRVATGGDTIGYQRMLREMVQAHAQARLGLQEGRGPEALELAARIRERWRTQNGEVSGSDAAFLVRIQAQLGLLGDYVPAALVQVRSRQGDPPVDGMRRELERLREQFQARLQAGDQEGADSARHRLRLAAAYMIRAGVGDGPCNELLAGNEQLMEQLRQRIAEHQRRDEDAGGEAEMLRLMTQLQEQARLALAAGRREQALELAARVRERWQAG